MHHFDNFLDMGGYAAFIWPSFGVTAITLVTLIAISLIDLRSKRRTFESMKKRHIDVIKRQLSDDA